MNGDPLLVSALLEMNADPNDATKQSKIMAPWWKVVVDWLQDGIYVINIDNKKKKCFLFPEKPYVMPFLLENVQLHLTKTL